MLKQSRLLIVPLILIALFCFTSYAAAELTTYQNVLTFGAYGTGQQDFKNPYGLDVDTVSGDIYIADTGNSMIKKFNRFGGYLNSFGSEGAGDGQLLYPQAVALDSSNNDIYVADTGSNRIQKFHIDGNNYTFTLKFGSEGSGNGQLLLPRDIAIDVSGNVYICDAGNNRIAKFNSSGVWMSNIGESASLKSPYGLTLDNAGNIYVADTFNNRVVQFAPDGTFLMQFGAYGTEAGQFTFPRDVSLDNNSNIFIADTDNHRIQKFDGNGAYINSFGIYTEFLTPQKIEIDGNNKLYVIDSNTNRLQVYDVNDYITGVYAEPDPFSPDGDGFADNTSIKYTIPESARITITIYDSANNLVRDLITDVLKVTDQNEDIWDGTDMSGVAVPAGVYTYKIDAVNALNYHPPQQSGTVTVIYPTGQISGDITDGVNPVSGAVVSDGVRSYSTDANGNYIIVNVPAGVYMITASTTGCDDASQLVSITDGEIITGVNLMLDCNMGPATSSISGSVSDGLYPISGATLTAGSETASTDSGGNYTISNLKAGTYMVTARRLLCSEASQVITLGTGEARTGTNFTLSCLSEPDIQVTPASLNFVEYPGGGQAGGGSQQSDYTKTSKSPVMTKVAEIMEAPGHAKDYEIKLKSRRFIPQAKEIKSQNDVAAKAKKLIGKTMHVLIQLDKLPTDSEKKALKDSGIELLSYIPDYAWIASVPATKADKLTAISQVRWTGALSRDDKISSKIQTKGLREWARNKDGSVNIFIQFFKDTPPDEASQLIARFAGKITRVSRLNNVFTVSIPEDKINDLADEDIVQWIEETPPPPVKHNDGVRESMKVNIVQAPPYQLDGSDVVVGIWDGGHVDAAHDDFGTRVVYGDSGSVDDHATHVGGTLGGNGTLSLLKGGSAGQWKGMATNTRIISFEWTDAIDEHNTAVNNYDVDISQNSWGYWIDEYRFNNCDLYGDYLIEDSDYDSIVKGAFGKRLNIVFSAGNERNDSDCGIPQNGGYRNIPPPATGKNIITVGAINSDDDSMTSFSSWGPVDDGRIKPDIVAPGCEKNGEGYIHSTLPGDIYGAAGWCGTSMSAPAVSGTVALLIEQFKSAYGANPLPSTIKGVLLHTAQDLENPGPDFKTGYGKINAQDAADIINNRALTEGSITASGETDVYSINGPEGSPELKVTLTWDDEPGTPGGTVDLMNDLDLVLISPSGIQYRPWILDPNNPSAPAAVGEDHINNMEQVYVPNPSSGAWTVRVTGTIVPYPIQRYSLISNLFNSIPPGSSPEGTLIIYNAGTRDLAITNISKTQTWLSIGQTALNIASSYSAGVFVTVDSTGLNPGTYTDQIFITSNDPDENVVTIPVTFTINASNISPISNPGGPYTGIEGRSIILNASGSSDSDGTIVSYEWDINNDGIYDYSSSSSTQNLAYAQNGAYIIRLRVTDNNGAASEATTTANILDASPTANFTASPATGAAPLTVNFINNSTGYDQPFSYDWDFDNNGTVDSNGQNPQYTYTNAGTYTLKLTVTDSDGSPNSLIRANYITVTPPGYTLTINKPGTGSGTVTSSPSGIDCGSDCTETYSTVTTVTLTAMPDAGSQFTGWTGGGCSGSGICTVTMDANKTITAEFNTCANLPVRIIRGGSPATSYSSIQTAYNNAIAGDILQSQAAFFTETLNINRDISLTLTGGYDCSYSTNAGETLFKGDMTINDGTIAIEKITLEQ